MRNNFSTFDIKKLLGIPRERLQAWMIEGYVAPSIPAPSQGKKAIFTRVDVYAVALFNDLLKIGFRRETTARFVSEYIDRIAKGAYDYIIFRTDTSFSEDYLPEAMPIPCSEKELFLSLRTGLLKEHKSAKITPEDMKLLHKYSRDWNSLVVFNLKHFLEKTEKLLLAAE
ncbi:hypothetical protein ACFLZQ_04095 [Thermodesulfobacteriota bacterium]